MAGSDSPEPSPHLRVDLIDETDTVPMLSRLPAASLPLPRTIQSEESQRDGPRLATASQLNEASAEHAPLACGQPEPDTCTQSKACVRA